jgi:hypothetical protein
MTAVFLFRIKPKKDKNLLLSELRSLLANVFEVDVLTRGPELDFYLEYAYGDPKEKGPIEKAIKYLQSNSFDKVIYVPCPDALDESTKVSAEEVSTDDIFERLYPSFSTKENLMYRINSN